MQLRIFQVDAFASRLFSGNPAAVCPLGEWLGKGLLQQIALENNLSETAFFVPQGRGYGLRWFTPTIEVSLCGHATLASAHVLWEHLGAEDEVLHFETRSGPVSVERQQNGLMALDFPALPAAPCRPPAALIDGLGRKPDAVLLAQESPDSLNYLTIYPSQGVVGSLRPDYRLLASLGPYGVIASGPGEDAGTDFVSRYFCPYFGIDEDPVTGSIHCTLTPYWSERLGKTQLKARQISARGGELSCGLRVDRVRIAGRAVTYLEGIIRLP